MIYPDALKLFTLPMEPDSYGGLSRGTPQVLIPKMRARVSVLSAADLHTALGISHSHPGLYWRVLTPPMPTLVWPAAVPMYVCVADLSSTPTLRVDKAYEVVKFRNQRHGAGSGHHSSWVIQLADQVDTSIFEFVQEDPNAVSFVNRWRSTFVWDGEATITLSGAVDVDDYLVLQTEHGGDRSLPQYSGVDFAILGDGLSISVSNILDIFEDGCTVRVVNYGKRPGIVWIENYTVVDGNDVKALSHSVKATDTLELTVETTTSRSLTYLSGHDFTASAPNSINIAGIDAEVGDVLRIVNYGEIVEV